MCHNSRCFPHILSEHKTHSVEALLVHNSDGTHQKYHYNHTAGRKARSEISVADLRNGPFGYPHLAYYASHFTHCKPIKSQFMKLGWYDKTSHLSYVSIPIFHEYYFMNTLWLHRYQMTKIHLRELKCDRHVSLILLRLYLPNVIHQLSSHLQTAYLALQAGVQGRTGLTFGCLQHHIAYLARLVIVSGARQFLQLLRTH